MSTSLFHPFGLYITLHQVFINSNFNVFNVFSLSCVKKHPHQIMLKIYQKKKTLVMMHKREIQLYCRLWMRPVGKVHFAGKSLKYWYVQQNLKITFCNRNSCLIIQNSWSEKTRKSHWKKTLLRAFSVKFQAYLYKIKASPLGWLPLKTKA